MQELSIHKPGCSIQIPPSIIDELRFLDQKRFQKKLTFFGGHPISITKKQYQTIFDEVVKDPRKQTTQSPYLVCQKTDGVRFLLIITNEKKYFVSREGSKSLVAYEAQCQVSNRWQSHPDKNNPFQSVIHVLDGEMIQDTKPKQKLRYLIFDALICFGVNIIHEPLRSRLNHINKFYECNKYLVQTFQSQELSDQIEVIVKDFFRLNCNTYTSSQVLRRKNIQPPTTIEFLFNNYIKCLPHQNDGIIFNHEEKQYILGTNPGYVKWKPPELNTVDFLVIPNTNLEDRYGRRILDLYLGQKDEDNIYRKLFYSFAVVDKENFGSLVDSQEELITRALNNQITVETTDQFFGLIAQCKFEPTNTQEQKKFRELYSRDRTPQQMRDDIMKPSFSDKQLQVMMKLKNQTYLKSWKIYKIRYDKNTPNNHSAASKIQDSIKDDIRVQSLIKENRKLLSKIKIAANSA